MKSSSANFAYTKLSPQDDEEHQQQKLSSKASSADDHVYYRPKKSAAAKKKRSCLEIFLYIVLITFSIVLFLSIALGTYGYYVLKHQVQRFTVTEPLELPIEPIPQVELELVKDRAKLFCGAIVVAGLIPGNDLTVTATEINGFIAASDYFAGNAHVNISKNKFAFELSLPVDGILPGGKGRYFVATGYDSIQTLEDGKSLFTTQLETLNPVEGLLEGSPLWLAQLLVYRDTTNNKDRNNNNYGGYVVNVQKAQFLNWFAPQDYIDQHENILDHLHEICDDPEMSKMIEQLFHGIEGISIGDNAVTIHARRSEFQHEDKFTASSNTIQGSSSSSSSSSDDDSSSSSSDDNRRTKWNYYKAGGGGTRMLLQKLLF